jgi:hypothetical protein
VKTLPETIRELWELVRAYALQELVDPLRGLHKYVGIGLGAAVLCSTGGALLLLGILRAVQTEGHRTFDARGDSSFLPYLVVFLLCVLGIAVLVSRINRQFGDRP